MEAWRHPDCVRCSSIFRKEWNLYRITLSEDYLYHADLYEALQKYLEGRVQQGQQLSMLDLGCGDSDALVRMLKSSPKLAASLQHYRGVDMSEPAMELSRLFMTRVLPAGALVEHVQADIVDHVSSCPPESFDVVLASFALHHLSSEKKQEVTASIARLLKPRGVFCLVDVFLEPGEGREQFQARFTEAIKGWNAMADRDLERMTNHVMECDFPEQVATYADWITSQVAAASVELLCARAGLYKAMAMQLPAAAAAAASAAAESNQA